MAELDDRAARRERLVRVWVAFLAWAFVSTGVGFMLARIAAGTSGQGTALFLYGSWLIGLLGFAATAAYLLRKR
jgi:hypothetical protein